MRKDYTECFPHGSDVRRAIKPGFVLSALTVPVSFVVSQSVRC